jgi:putative NADH-flavin reductase
LKVVVFGATGGTGLEVVKQGLEQGQRVTAFVRDPSKLPIQHAALLIMPGDAMNPSQVEEAIREKDAVISALGVTRQTPLNLCSQGTKNILTAMRKNGVKRIIIESAYGAGDTKKGFYGRTTQILIASRIRDKELMEKTVEESGLDWVISRPVRLTNGPRTGAYRVGVNLPVNALPTISRADVAEWMLKQLSDNAFLHTTTTITY